MNDEKPKPRRSTRADDYRLARIGAGIGLTVTTMVLLIYDAATPSYEIQAFILITIVTTILTLFGLELADQIKKD